MRPARATGASQNGNPAPSLAAVPALRTLPHGAGLRQINGDGRRATRRSTRSRKGRKKEAEMKKGRCFCKRPALLEILVGGTSFELVTPADVKAVLYH